MRATIEDNNTHVERFVVRAPIGNMPDGSCAFGYLKNTTPEPYFVNDAAQAHFFTMSDWANKIAAAMGPEAEVCAIYIEIGEPINSVEPRIVSAQGQGIAAG